MGLVDAFITGAEEDREPARDRVRAELGPEAFVDAGAVFGNFEMMNRVAEGTGIPIAPQALEREAAMMRALGLTAILKSQQRQV